MKLLFDSILYVKEDHKMINHFHQITFKNSFSTCKQKSCKRQKLCIHKKIPLSTVDWSYNSYYEVLNISI